MMYRLGTKSRSNLEGVHPLLQDVVRVAITVTDQDFTVLEGVRSRDTQRDYVTRGVSRTMNSKHLIQNDGYSHAVDLVPYINRSLRWEIDLCCVIARAMRCSASEQEASIRWGGAWATLPEGDHEWSPSALVEAYIRRKVWAGRRAFVDGVHFELRV